MWLYLCIVEGMKRGMTIEYLKCRKELNFDVDSRVNGVIGLVRL